MKWQVDSSDRNNGTLLFFNASDGRCENPTAEIWTYENFAYANAEDCRRLAKIMLEVAEHLDAHTHAPEPLATKEKN